MSLSEGSRHRRTVIILAAVLIVAAVLRLYNNNWDDFNHVHPDERWITMVVTDISWPDDLGQALQPQGTTLNPFYNANRGEPRNFAYGHLPVYLVRFTASLVSKAASVGARLARDSDLAPRLASWTNATDYGHVNLVGRIISGLADTVTVLFVFLLGRRLYDERVGLLAAALITFTVLHIQLAHFYAFDVIMVTFIVAAIYFDVEVVLRGDVRSSVLAGACTALAVSSKFTAIPLLVPLGVAHALRLAIQPSSNPATEQPDNPAIELAGQRPSGPLVASLSRATARGAPTGLLRWDAARFNETVRLLIISLAVAAVVFFVTSPFAILDLKHYAASITEQNRMVRGEVDWPYTRQYRHTLPYLYHIQQLLLWGMGVPLGATALAGFGFVILRALRRRLSLGEWVILAWAIPYFALTGSFMVKFMRYMLLLTPFLAIFAAYFLFQVAGRRSQVAGLTSHVSRLTHHVSRFTPHASRLTFHALTGFVLVSTVFWALAFMQVYTHRLTRVEASEWIYRNIPKGATTTWEGWDDPLPFDMTIDGQWLGRGEFRQLRMDLYEPDGQAKLQHIKDTLRQAEYVIISSKRLWAWLPHMPDRYPVNNRYYELLFDERLGFRLLRTFTSYPRLAGLVFNDDGSDESFTVYDHPKVLVFQKERDLSDAEFESLFGDAVDAGEQWNRQPASARSAQAQPKKTLLLDEPVDELPAVADLGWNRLANAHPVLSVVTWWLVVQILGLMAWPITFVLFRNFADRGYILAKTLGILAVAYVIWILGSLRLAVNNLLTAALALVLVSLCSWFIWRRHGQDMRIFWQRRRRLILINEGLFAAAFLLFVGIRLLNPDLWQPWLGGEKSMEFAFLNASYRTPYFPPYDPYYAGGYLNYYYYGMFLIATLIRLSGIIPSVAFNLAIPLLFALTASNVFCVVFNLMDRKGTEGTEGTQGTRGSEGTEGTEGTQGTEGTTTVGPSSSLSSLSSTSSFSSFSSFGFPLLASVFVVLLGNLDGLLQIVGGLGEIGGSGFKSSIPGLEPLVRSLPGLRRMIFGDGRLPRFDYWRSTRVIPFTINEFPFFSFLFADLHPHMMGIPFTIFVLALALNVVLDARRRGSGGWWPARGLSYLAANVPILLSPWNVLSTLALALTIGAVAVINTWDLPTYLGLAFCAVFLQQYLVNQVAGRRSQVAGPRSHVSRFTFHGRLESLPHSPWFGVPLISALICFVPVAVLSLLLYWPFFAHYQAISVGIGLVRMRTEMGKLLTIWGLPLFVVVSLLVAGLMQRDSSGLLRFIRLVARRWERLPRLLDLHRALVREPGAVYVLGRYALALAVLAAIGLAVKGMAGVALLVVILILAALLFLRQDATPEEHFINLMAFTGLAVLLGVEIVFLRDFLQGGDHYRMNTVFKFYIQVWVLLGLAAGAGLPRILAALKGLPAASRPHSSRVLAPDPSASLRTGPSPAPPERRIRRWGAGLRPALSTVEGASTSILGAAARLRVAWLTVFILLLAGSLIYTVLGTAARVNDRFPGARPAIGTLDGMAYMTVGSYTWPDPNNRIELRHDYEAIQWLLRNVKGTPVVAEGRIDYYREGGMRVASYTGLPTLLGAHQNEQRYDWQVGQRDGKAREFYNTASPERALDLIRELNISYVYVGQLERSVYATEGIAKFDRLKDQGHLDVVYENEKVRIYRVRG